MLLVMSICLPFSANAQKNKSNKFQELLAAIDAKKLDKEKVLAATETNFKRIAQERNPELDVRSLSIDRKTGESVFTAINGDGETVNPSGDSFIIIIRSTGSDPWDPAQYTPFDAMYDWYYDVDWDYNPHGTPKPDPYGTIDNIIDYLFP